jgi:hypothetical protein
MELTPNDPVIKQFKELTPQNRSVVVQEQAARSQKEIT